MRPWIGCGLFFALAQALAGPQDDPAASPSPVAPRAAEDTFAYDGGRFVIAHAESAICVIALQGVITRDAAFKFDDVIKRSAALGCVKPWLLLESRGGSLDAGIRLGKEVHAQGLRTVARGNCASACALIFLAGSERVLAGPRARIGLHQAAIVRPTGDERWCAKSIATEAARDMRRYLRAVNAATGDQIAEMIMRTSCDTIEWIDGSRAVDLGIATRLEPGATDTSTDTGRKP